MVNEPSIVHSGPGDPHPRVTGADAVLQRNLLSNYLGQAWIALMGIAFIPQYIRYLGIEAYGLVGLFSIISACLGLLEMGLTPTLSREMARFTAGSRSPQSLRDLLRTMEITALALAVAIAVFIYLTSPRIAAHWVKSETLSIDTITHAIYAMGLVASSRLVESLYRSSLVGLQHQAEYNLIGSVMATLRWYGAVVILAVVSSTIEAFFLWQALTSLASLLILRLATYRHLPAAVRRTRWAWVSLREVWGFARGMLLIAFLSVLLTQVDKIVLSAVLPLTEYGYYTLSSVVAGGLFLLINPISQAWFPRLSQLVAAGDEEQLNAVFHLGAQLVAVVAGSAAIMLMVFAEKALLAWTGDAILAARVAPLLRLLVAGNLLNGLMWMPYQTLLAYGWTSLPVAFNVLAIAVTVPAVIMLSPRYGATAAAWVWIALNLFYIVFAVRKIHTRILRGQQAKWYINDCLLPLGAAATSAVCFSLVARDEWSTLTNMAYVAAVSSVTLAISLLAAVDLRKRALEWWQRGIAHRSAV